MRRRDWVAVLVIVAVLACAAAYYLHVPERELPEPVGYGEGIGEIGQ